MDSNLDWEDEEEGQEDQAESPLPEGWKWARCEYCGEYRPCFADVVEDDGEDGTEYLLCRDCWGNPDVFGN